MLTKSPAPSESVFEAERPHLFGLAYRMLGSVADAEDVVQDAFLRWRSAAADVRSAKAYLTTIVTRLSIDRLRVARHERETYVGPWLPEPLVTEEAQPDAQAELAESLSLAFLALLESLQPVERAVFLLHEAFQYSHDEIAAIVEKSSENCRQILSRARKQLNSGRPRFRPQPERQRALVERFIQSCRTGDVPALVEMLVEDVEFRSDGGGKAAAALVPIRGADKVARLLCGITRKGGAGLAARFLNVNGQLAIVRYEGDAARDVTLLDFAADGRIRAIHGIRNPDKLGRIPPLARDEIEPRMGHGLDKVKK